MAKQVIKKNYQMAVYASMIARIVIGLGIFMFPFATSFLEFILDWGDGELYKRAGYHKLQYDIIDKVLDYYWYCLILLFVLISNVQYKSLFIILFLFRSIGQFLYFITRKEWILFVFPNIFEIAFYFYLIDSVFLKSKIQSTPPVFVGLLCLITIIVLVREYILHIKKVNLSWFFTGKKTLWVDG